MSPATPLTAFIPDAASLISEAVDVLRAIIRDATATPETRRRAAASLLHFLVPRPSARPRRSDAKSEPTASAVGPNSADADSWRSQAPPRHPTPSSTPTGDSRLAIPSVSLGLAFPHRAPTPASRLIAAAGSTRSLDTS